MLSQLSGGQMQRIAIARCLSMELLMPAGISTVLNDAEFAPDELSMAIIEGLCDEISEESIDGSRVKLKFKLKRE